VRHIAQEATFTKNDQSNKILLLGDIRTAFDVAATDRLSTEDLVQYLTGQENRPWAEWRTGKPMTKSALSRMLNQFKIYSGSIRLSDGRTPKGFYRQSFEDAFARYLPKSDATTPQARSHEHFGDFQSATPNTLVAHPKPPQICSHQPCGVVAVYERGLQADEKVCGEHISEEGSE
jgi:hypothetical protein